MDNNHYNEAKEIYKELLKTKPSGIIHFLERMVNDTDFKAELITEICKEEQKVKQC